MLALIALAEGRVEAAIETLAQAHRLAARGAFSRSSVESAVLHAVAEEQAGLHDGACEWIERAALAEAEKLRRPFLDAGPAVAPLLRRTIRAGSAHRWLAGTVLGVLEGREDEGGAPPHGLLQPLSAKERMVLRYLPTLRLEPGDRGRAVPRLSNTIKTHLKSIYRKLDTSNRREAVQRARELRLLGLTAPVRGVARHGNAEGRRP